MVLSDKEIEVLGVLEGNGLLPFEDIAKMVNIPVDEVESIVKKMQENNIIIRFSSVIDWSKITGHEGVTAMIDVKVTPKRDVGFDEIAKRIYQYDEVQSVYLMSGAYDLSVIIKGHSLNEVARFVSEKLSTLDSVISTTTHFILKKYKHDGTIFDKGDEDKRIVVSP
jgi:DNA-binding Lrp family transcriptional regulator